MTVRAVGGRDKGLFINQMIQAGIGTTSKVDLLTPEEADDVGGVDLLHYNTTLVSWLVMVGGSCVPDGTHLFMGILLSYHVTWHDATGKTPTES